VDDGLLYIFHVDIIIIFTITTTNDRIVIAITIITVIVAVFRCKRKINFSPKPAFFVVDRRRSDKGGWFRRFNFFLLIFCIKVPRQIHESFEIPLSFVVKVLPDPFTIVEIYKLHIAGLIAIVYIYPLDGCPCTP